LGLAYARCRVPLAARVHRIRGVDLPHDLSATADRDDPGPVCRQRAVNQRTRQREVSEVADPEVPLESVRCRPVGHKEDACVVEEDIPSIGALLE